MAVAPTTPSTPTAAGRRFRAGALMGFTLLLAIGSAVVLNMLALRYDRRWDVTATGEQRLADRTRKLLDAIKEPHRFVIAVDLKRVDPRVHERVADVLTEMRRRNSNLAYSIIDTGSPRGPQQFRAVVADLVKDEGPLIREQIASIDLGVAGVTSLSTYLNDTAAPALLSIREVITGGTPEGQANRAFFEQSAARARLTSRDLSQAAASASDSLKARVGDIELPATDKAGAALVGALGQAVDQLDSLSREMQRFIESPPSAGPARDQAAALVPALKDRRDKAAVLFDSLRRLKRPDVLRLVDVLRGGSAALLIGPGGHDLAAIDVEALFPSAEYLDATGTARADLSRRSEELFTTALASLIQPKKPIVMLVHGAPRTFVNTQEYFGQLRQRLALRGIDLVEWALLADPEPPGLGAIDPDGTRPVVYVALSPDASAPAQSRGELTGAQKADRVAQVLDSLLTQGKPLLLNLPPSVLPTYGDADPYAKLLERFGLKADTGAPLLWEQTGRSGRGVETDRVLFSLEGSHPIAGAVRGLPTKFIWPIAISQIPLADSGRASVSWLYDLPADPQTWEETQWLRLRQTRREQRSLIPDQPVFNEGQDGRWPLGKPTDSPQAWHVAAAVERVTGKAQRFVVVGSHEWFLDNVTQEAAQAEGGRAVPANPGNLELFEACVYWLAGQDSLIAQSPGARASAIVMPIEHDTLVRLELILIAGVPVGVLVLGSLYLFIRR